MAEHPTQSIPDFTGLTSFDAQARVAVFGASGGIGRAFIEHLVNDPSVAHVYGVSRQPPTDLAADSLSLHAYDPLDDDSLGALAATMKADGPVDLVISAIGLLHHEDQGIEPEKTWRHLQPENLAAMYTANAVVPIMIAKHMLPLLPRDRKAGYAALSARVGSISDNRIGGWYGYRAAKAALNQHIRCAAIELARRYDQAFCIGLHPGTVDTGLSKPFQKQVAEHKLFTPAFSAGAMLQVIDQISPDQSGGLFACDGEEIAP
ncbi:MAG: SDR family NAD(P)-dependent oxidoreductase [Pseudomonadota bacterium]